MLTIQEKTAIEARVVKIAREAQRQDAEPDVDRLKGAAELRRDPKGRFLIAVKDAPRQVGDLSPEYRINVAGVRDLWRPYKRKRYLAKRKDENYKGPVIVAEGDSWFEYPFAKDMIYWLSEHFAILSLARAGDTWSDIFEQEYGPPYSDGSRRGLFATVAEEVPDIVLLSVGGNEFLGRIEDFVRPWKRNRPRNEYIIWESFNSVIDYIIVQYQSVVTQIVERFGAKVILHTYDYTNPREDGIFIGGPLRRLRNMEDHTLWREIVGEMLHTFRDRMKGLESNHVVLVDLLGTIGSRDWDVAPNEGYWAEDEVHPSDEGAILLAAKMKREINRIWSVAPGA